MKNSLLDLNNHLFCALERLNDEKLKGDKLTEELNRSKAITGIAREAVANAKVMLEAQIALGGGNRPLPTVFGLEHK
ncbi:hypothetical protein AB4876_09300 [Zhongshania guokunii]|uniref:Phage protein n=1 Tax=Zhongshania guokunii TaxID=641783 RepID=A0ABV3U6A2_9GAMM